MERPSADGERTAPSFLGHAAAAPKKAAPIAGVNA
jgi:hypothetical protein